MNNEELSLIENIVRTARKGKNRAVNFKEDEYLDVINRLTDCVDLFQHIQDEALYLLPENNRLKINDKILKDL